MPPDSARQTVIRSVGGANWLIRVPSNRESTQPCVIIYGDGKNRPGKVSLEELDDEPVAEVHGGGEGPPRPIVHRIKTLCNLGSTPGSCRSFGTVKLVGHPQSHNFLGSALTILAYVLGGYQGCKADMTVWVEAEPFGAPVAIDRLSPHGQVLARALALTIGVGKKRSSTEVARWEARDALVLPWLGSGLERPGAQRELDSWFACFGGQL
jgi:hypothetical protein